MLRASLGGHAEQAGRPKGSTKAASAADGREVAVPEEASAVQRPAGH